MRGRALLLLVLLLAGAVGGCLGDDDGPPPSDGTDTGRDGDRDRDTGGSSSNDDGTAPPADRGPRLPSPFVLEGFECRTLELHLPADQAQARAALPEGFSTVAYTAAEAAPSAGGQATLVATFTTCPSGGLIGGAQGGYALHALSLLVTVPEGLRDEAALEDRFLVEAVAEPAELARAFGERGWAVAEGSTALTATETPVGAGAVEATGSGGNLSTTASVTVAGTNTSVQAGYLRLWHAPGDRLEYFHQAFAQPYPVLNATGPVRADGSDGTTAAYVGPAKAATGVLAGPQHLVGAPVVARSG